MRPHSRLLAINHNAVFFVALVGLLSTLPKGLISSYAHAIPAPPIAAAASTTNGLRPGSLTFLAHHEVAQRPIAADDLLLENMEKSLFAQHSFVPADADDSGRAVFQQAAFLSNLPPAAAPQAGTAVALAPSPTIKVRPTTVYRPRSVDLIHEARVRSMRYGESIPFEWVRAEVLGPDVQDRHTLIQLAKMAGDAYALPGKKNWYEVDDAWNKSFPIGWEDPEDGFRGHVFLSADNSTVVLSIKGTTLQGPTSRKDKFNDNLLFSCCCARVDITWVFRTVCDCYANRWRCDNQCLHKSLVQDSLFYSVGTKLISDIAHLYPQANLWLVGHSLGGALASLLGSTYGLPAVAFESPGEKLAASRLHLPLPRPHDGGGDNDDQFPELPIPRRPSGELPRIDPHSAPSPLGWSSLGSTNYTITDPAQLRLVAHKGQSSGRGAFMPRSLNPPVAVTHVYHTGDPIPLGTCKGSLSSCAQGGYALETRCHLGKSIVYDTLDKLGWVPNVRRHIIREVIHNVLEAEDVEWEEGREVPLAREEADCVDCSKWEFGDFKDDKGDKRKKLDPIV